MEWVSEFIADKYVSLEMLNGWEESRKSSKRKLLILNVIVEEMTASVKQPVMKLKPV